MSLPHSFSSTDPGAPSLSGAQGSLLEVLRACLVNGYGAKPVTNIVVASGVATVTCAVHGFTGLPGARVQVLGFSVAGLNGVHQPYGVTTNSFLFDAPGVADGTYTAASTSAKRAPAGWTEVFTATDRSVFKSSSPEASGSLLRVFDPLGYAARINVYESMTDIDTGLGMMPTAGQLAGGGFWSKSSTQDATARPWRLFADDRGFYFCPAPSALQPGNHTLFYAGDVVSNQAGDAFGFMLAANTNVADAYTGTPTGCVGLSYRYAFPLASTGKWIQRQSSGLGDAIVAACVSRGGNTTSTGVYSGAPGFGYSSGVNPAGNLLMYVGVDVVSQQDGYRGELPGLRHILQGTPSGVTTDSALTYQPRGSDAISAIGIRCGLPSASGAGVVAFVMSQDWRD